MYRCFGKKRGKYHLLSILRTGPDLEAKCRWGWTFPLTVIVRAVCEPFCRWPHVDTLLLKVPCSVTGITAPSAARPTAGRRRSAGTRAPCSRCADDVWGRSRRSRVRATVCGLVPLVAQPPPSLHGPNWLPRSSPAMLRQWESESDPKLELSIKLALSRAPVDGCMRLAPVELNTR